jgi:VCBS repeat-containing protein
MAAAKGGLTVAIKFTPQAQSDTLTLGEDQLNDRSQSLTNALDATQNVLANDGGGAGTQIMGIVAGDAVDAVKANLTNYVDLNNFSTPKAGYSTATIGSGDLQGSVTLSNGGLTYVPAGDISFLSAGETVIVGTFTYIIRMGNGAFSVTTATIKLVGDNDVPVATADSAAVNEDSVFLGSVATNDHDVDHLDVLSYALNTPVDGLAFNGDGSYSFNAGHESYQHLAAGQTATIVTSYTVSDGHGGTATSTLSITVTGTNDAPVAQVAPNSGAEDGTISGSVHATDVDDGAVLSYAVDGPAPAGFTLNADGSYTLDAGNAAYQHLAEGATQQLVISYTATDEHGASSQSTLTINLAGVNDAPVAGADAADVNEDSTITGSVAGNDKDADDGAVLTFSMTDDIAGLTFNADGSYSFDASDAAYQSLGAGQTMDVVANYSVTDEHGASSASTLTLTVHGANEAPPPPEPTLHSATVEWSVDGKTDANGGQLDLLGGNWSNFQLSVNGMGDFDWDSEGFDLSGDATATFRGLNDSNSTGNSTPETDLNVSTGNVTVSVDTAKLADGSFDYDVNLTNPTSDKSLVHLTLTYDYWA